MGINFSTSGVGMVTRHLRIDVGMIIEVRIHNYAMVMVPFRSGQMFCELDTSYKPVSYSPGPFKWGGT